MRVELAARRENILGEGPLWDSALGRLYWVDIRAKCIEWIEPASGSEGRYDLAVRPSALALCEMGELLVAADHSVGLLDVLSGAFTPRVVFEEDKPRNRTNDGGIGADGRFWFGTMDDDAEAGRGALYALSPDWKLSVMREPLGIPNGIVMTSDGGKLFVADSMEGVIWAHGVAADGALSEPSLFFSAKGGASTPDGAALDEEGYIWSAQWDGGCMLRIAPDGAVDRKIDMPVTRPTACAFGGPDLTTLYVTSARGGLSANRLAREPLAGSVFSVATGIAGLHTRLFAKR
jgi:sugar lactone lactonase YvrE